MFSSSKILFSTILIFSLHICLVFPTQYNNIRGRRFICGTRSPDLVKVNCSFKRVNRTTEFWSFQMDYLIPMKNIHVNITNYRHQQNLQYKPQTVIGFHGDYCKWMEGSLKNSVFDIFRDGFKKYGNVLKPCPHYGKIYLRNMVFDDAYYPPIVPAGFSYVDFQFYTYLNGSLRYLQYLRPYLEISYKGIIHW